MFSVQYSDSLREMADDAIEILEFHFKEDRFIALTIRTLIKLSELPMSIRVVNRLPFNLTILVMGGDLSPSLTQATITAKAVLTLDYIVLNYSLLDTTCFTYAEDSFIRRLTAPKHHCTTELMS